MNFIPMQSIVDKKNWMDKSVRCQSYTKKEAETTEKNAMGGNEYVINI